MIASLMRWPVILFSLTVPAVAQPALTGPLVTHAAAAWAERCPDPSYPAPWVWGADAVAPPRSATHGTPKIEQIRGGRVIATYRSFDDRPGCDYRTPPDWQSPAAAAASGCGPFTRGHAWRLWAPGDKFLVHAAIYAGEENQPYFGSSFDSPTQYADGHGTPTALHDVTISGLVEGGERPVILVDGHASNNTMGQGVVYFDDSTNLTFENIDVVAVKGSWVGRSGIYDVGGSDLTIRNVRVSNFGQQDSGGANGLFGAGHYTGFLHLDQVELDHNGGQNGPAHNAYINASLTDPNFTVAFRNSWSHDAYYGHLFKSRAQHTVIEGSYLQGGRPQPGQTQSEAYLLDVPNGGQLEVVNSIFVKTASGTDSNGVAIAYHEEGDLDGFAPRRSKVAIENNDLVAMASTYDGRHPTTPFWIKDPPRSVVIRNNMFAGWCLVGDDTRDLRGELSLTLAPSEIDADFALRIRYDGAGGVAQSASTYRHVALRGEARRKLTVGARD